MRFTTPTESLVNSLLPASGVALIASLCIGVLLVLTKKWHGRLTLDSMHGVQKLHAVPTPRVGGFPVFCGLLAAVSYLPHDAAQLLGPVLIAGTPAFVAGMLEDVTKQVGVTHRLLATMASGLVAALITGQWLARIDIVGLDQALQWAPFGMLFTAFAVGGVANSINIIDGLNGLAGIAVTAAFGALAMMAAGVGDTSLAITSITMAASVLGFLLLNWPFGKIFLGDGGAYFLGFSLAWIGIQLVSRNPTVSAFAVLLTCAHPVAEVLFSIYRRSARREHPGAPDNLHLHSLIKKRYVRRWFSDWSPMAKNSAAGLMASVPSLVTAVVAVWVATSAMAALLACLLFLLGYLALYSRMCLWGWGTALRRAFSRS